MNDTWRALGKQKLITCESMATGAKHMLGLANTQEKGQFYTVTASLLYSAFTLEAYLNYLGPDLDKNWKCNERMSVIKKLKKLAEEVSVKCNMDERPYRTLTKLFEFRNSRAHGRTLEEESTGEEKIDQETEWSEGHLPMLGEWSSSATPEYADEVFKDVGEIICEFNKACIARSRANVEELICIFHGALPDDKTLGLKNDTHRVRGKQKLITYGLMGTGAKHMLGLAKTQEEGQFYTVTASLLYSAFTLEAYLNYLGPELDKNWRCNGRMPVIEKFKKLAKEVSVKFNMDERPYGTLTKLFKFRNSRAHGRTVVEKIDQGIEWSEGHLPMVEEWSSSAKPEYAEEVLKDITEIIRELGEACIARINANVEEFICTLRETFPDGKVPGICDVGRDRILKLHGALPDDKTLGLEIKDVERVIYDFYVAVLNDKEQGIVEDLVEIIRREFCDRPFPRLRVDMLGVALAPSQQTADEPPARKD